MRIENLTKAITVVIVQSILLGAIAFGQPSNRNTGVNGSRNEFPAAVYLYEVTPNGHAESVRISKRIADLLVTPNGKNAVLIDEHGHARDGVLQGVANRLNAGSKRVYRVAWNALFSNIRDETALAAEFNRIAAFLST